MPSNGYVCNSGRLTAAGTIGVSTSGPGFVQAGNLATAVPALSMTSGQFRPPSWISDVHTDMPSRAKTSAPAEESSPPQTCERLHDTNGIRSCIEGGKMASVYDAGRGSTFRCDWLEYPEDEMFVAVWTPYNSTLAAKLGFQPAPVNCGQRMNLTNRLTGKSASGLVLDRCQSCIGIGGQLNDPTTDHALVNGATVDLSRALWNELFHDAPNNVYDIWYEGEGVAGDTMKE